MSQVYSSYTGTKPAEQLASGDGQEWLSCEVCSLTFKNQQHYSIHCGGTFHANRVAASLRTQQTSTKTSSQEDPQAAFGGSNNPSYWTGMQQQAFSFAPAPQRDPSSQKLASRAQIGQGHLNTTSADAYQGQMEYVSYPVGKQAAKQPSSDSKTAAGGYDGLYGMPGFGWSDMQPDPSKFDYQSQQYPATAQLPDLQQMKVGSASKPALHDAWKNYQPQPERSGAVPAGKDFGSRKAAVDYGYSTQEVAAYSSQKSDVPSWMKMIEPAVQKTESYKSSNKSTLYGTRDPFTSNASSTRSTEREDPWKSAANYETDVRGQNRQTKEGSYGKTEPAVRTKTRWDTDDSLSRDGKQRGGNDLDRQNTGGRRREDRDSLGRGGYNESKESSNSRNSEDSYRKRESGRWEDARERDASNKDVPPYGAKKTTDKREIGSNAEVGKGREDTSGWDSSYTGQASSAAYTNRRDVPSFSSKGAGRDENVQLRDQGVANKAAGKQDIQQFGQTESWDAYGQGWQQARAPDASSWKQGAATLDKKPGYDQQRQTSWGGEAVQGKTDTSWTQAEGHGMWDAAYVSSAASGGNSWSAAPGYASAGFPSNVGQNEKTSAQGRADKGSWNQKEAEKNSFGQLQGGNTWPVANSGHGVGSDLRRSSGIAGEQEWRSVNDVLTTFKQASKVPGQKPCTGVGSSAYGDLNQEVSSFATRPLPAAKSGQRTSDPQGGYDWSWTHGAEDKQPDYGEYNEQEYATATDPYHQGVSEWSGSYSAGRGGFPQPGLRDANKVGQKVAPAANQWTGWPNTEQRADVRGSASFAKDQQANQIGGLGRGQSGYQDVKSLGRGGVGYGRSQVKEIEKPVGLSRSGDRTEKQDWGARPFNHGAQAMLGKTPDVSSSAAENASWLRAQEVSGATSAGRGRGGGGRGVVGNKSTPQPGEIGGWRQGFQEQGTPSASAGRGGPIRGSESSLPAQKNSWGFGGAGVKPAASLTKGFEKGQEGKSSSNLQEKMRQLSEQAFTMDWSEKGKDWQESGKSVQASFATPGQRNSSTTTPGQRNLSTTTPGQRNLSGAAPGQRNSSVGAPGQRNSSVAAPGQRNLSGAAPGQRNLSIGAPGQSNSSGAAVGQRANQTKSSVPSLLNLNVAPTGKSQKTAGIEDKHSRDAANSIQKSSGAMQPPSSSAFSGKKPEQSPTSTKMISGSAIAQQPVTASSKQESVTPSAGKNVSSTLNRPPSQQSSVQVQAPASSVPAQKTVTPTSRLLPTPSMQQPQNQNKPNTSVQAAIKKPVGPTTVTVSGQSQSNFDRLDPASARKTGSAGDSKQKVTVLGSSSSVVSSQASSVTAKQTGISNVVPSKELAAANINRSASKLDSKVTPAAAAAAETKTGLKSSDSQLRSNLPSVTSSSSAVAAAGQPVITAKPATAALASSTANTPRLDSSKKPIAQKNVPVAAPPRDKKKTEDVGNDDECDPALSEALGQFFSEDGPSETAKPAVPAKKTTGSTKFVPTIRTYAVKSLAGFSKENPSGGKSDSSGEDNAKKSEQTKKPSPATITIKIENEDFISPGKGEGKAEGKEAGDPVAALSKWLPPNLLKGIASGHLSKELLEKVADLVPADALKQAVEYLQDSSKTQSPPASTTEAKESQQGLQSSGASVDVMSKAKADEEKSKTKVVDTARKAGKPVETLSRVQVIQPRKGLSNPAAVTSTTAKGPVTGSIAKTPVDAAGISKQPGSLASATKPPVQSCATAGLPSKRKYDDIDLAKLKNLTFDEMLQLFQELLKDVLGSLFEEDQKPSAIGEKKILDSLSVKDREMALKVRQKTGIKDLSRITHTMNVLKTLNAETIEALGQLDKSIIASSLTGNERAQKMGVTVLQQITELIMAKGTSDAKQIGGVGGAQVPVGRGRGGSVRPPQPGSSSSGRGVQSLLTMNFADTPKVGALSAGLATGGATRHLLPTPHLQQRPRFSMGGMMSAQGMGLLPMPQEQAHLNFPQPRFLRKRGPPLQSDASSSFFGSGPPIKRWR